jgi:hypothetical protein
VLIRQCRDEQRRGQKSETFEDQDEGRLQFARFVAQERHQCRKHARIANLSKRKRRLGNDRHVTVAKRVYQRVDGARVAQLAEHTRRIVTPRGLASLSR